MSNVTEYDETENQQCTFKPIINHKSEQLAIEKRRMMSQTLLQEGRPTSARNLFDNLHEEADVRRSRLEQRRESEMRASLSPAMRSNSQNIDVK